MDGKKKLSITLSSWVVDEMDAAREMVNASRSGYIEFLITYGLWCKEQGPMDLDVYLEWRRKQAHKEDTSDNA